jgi:3-oxoacyl-[acyl-carrier protein] reductase
MIFGNSPSSVRFVRLVVALHVRSSLTSLASTVAVRHAAVAQQNLFKCSRAVELHGAGSLVNHESTIMDISGKVAIVTGAAGGIGRALALELAKRGAGALALVDAQAAVTSVAAEVKEFAESSVRTEAFVGDVTNERFRRHVFAETVLRLGVPRICVPTAGITRDNLAVKLDKSSGDVLLYSIDDFHQTLEVNLVAPVYWALETVGCIAAARRRAGLGKWQADEHVQGTVVFIGSVSSQGNKGQIAYAATKAGLEGAAATLSKEAVFYGIRCAVIHPGYTDTPMVRKLGDDFIRDKILPQTQLGRLIHPSEIADAICFMISNSAVSGQLWADAGWHTIP